MTFFRLSFKPGEFQTDTEGREVTFTRSSGRITQLTVSSSAVGDYGNLTIDYEYTSDRLTKVTKHYTRQSDGGTKVRPYTEYTYLSSGVFDGDLDLVKDCGTTVLNFDYTAYNTDEDRCTKVTDADGEIHEYDFDQGDANDDWTEYTDPFGQSCDFVYEDLSAEDRTIKERRDYLEDEDGNDISTAAVTQFTRDCDCGRITEIEYTDGSKEKWSYDSYGNTTKYTRVSKNGSDTDLVKQWTYDTFANRSRMLTSSGWLRKEANPAAKVTYTWNSNGTLQKVAWPAVTSGQPSSQTIEFEYTWNSDGTLDTVEQPNGDKSEYSYSGDDLTRTDDPDTGGLQRAWLTERDLFGNLTSREDPTGATSAWDYTVTPDGRVLKVEGPNGQETKFEYDLRGRKTKEDKLLSGTSTRVATLFTVSDGGQVTQVEADDGGIEAISTFEIDETNRFHKSIDPDKYGSKTTVGYGYHGLPWKMYNRDENPATPVDTRVMTYERDTMGRVTAEVQQGGTRVEFEYDGYGRRIKTITDLPSSKERETVLTLKDWGAVDKQEVKVGTTIYATTTFSYDEAVRLWKETREDPENLLSDRVTEYQRDQNGRVAKRKDPRLKTWETQWDAVGRKKKVIDPVGNEMQFSYNDSTRETTITSHEKDTSDNTFTDYVVIETKDASGRVTSIEDEGSAGGTNSRTISFEYDKAGRRTKKTSELGFETTWEYDKLGRQTKMTRPIDSGTPVLTAPTTITLTDGGRRTKVTDANSVETEWTYNAFGQVLTTKYKNGAASSTYTKTYDSYGRTDTITDPLGAVLDYTYDAGGRVSQVDVTKNSSGLIGPDRVVYVYDDMDRATSGKTQEKNGAAYDDLTTVTRAYNGFGELKSETQHGSYTFSFSYDDAGVLKEITYPSGGPVVGVKYTFDDNGRVDKVERKLSTDVEGISTSQWEDCATFEYEGSREIERIQDPYDLKRTQTWTAFKEPETLKYLKDSTSALLTGLSSYWDDDGRMVVRSRLHDEDSYKWGEVYRYDEMDRLVKMWRNVQDPHNFQSTDPVEANDTFDDRVTYNLGKVYEREDVKVKPDGGTETTTDYTNNDYYQYTDVGGTTHSWDANGQLTDNGDWAFKWTGFGQLAEADPDTGTTREFEYDAFKRRVKTTAGSDVEKYFYVNWKMLGEHDGTDWIWQEVPGRGGVAVLEHIALDSNDVDEDLNTSEFRQYATQIDHQETFLGLSDSSGTIVERYRYRDPYGDSYTEDAQGQDAGDFSTEIFCQKRVNGATILLGDGLYDLGSSIFEPKSASWFLRQMHSTSVSPYSPYARSFPGLRNLDELLSPALASPGSKGAPSSRQERMCNDPTQCECPCEGVAQQFAEECPPGGGSFGILDNVRSFWCSMLADQKVECRSPCLWYEGGGLCAWVGGGDLTRINICVQIHQTGEGDHCLPCCTTDAYQIIRPGRKLQPGRYMSCEDMVIHEAFHNFCTALALHEGMELSAARDKCGHRPIGDHSAQWTVCAEKFHIWAVSGLGQYDLKECIASLRR
ncbi:MAG: RHS repeat protein [Planctomycetota bacterium]|nr:MAG: RHS repeat protein [Planctomycetota bacterium]